MLAPHHALAASPQAPAAAASLHALRVLHERLECREQLCGSLSIHGALVRDEGDGEEGGSGQAQYGLGSG